MIATLTAMFLSLTCLALGAAAFGLFVFIVARSRQSASPAPARRSTPLDDDLGDLEEELAVRLIVLAAHVRGGQLGESPAASRVARFEVLVAEVDERDGEIHDGALRRAAYGALTLAEAARGGPSPRWRRSAQQVGARMAERGTTDPYPLYMRVVDATTRAVETGNFQDITRDGVVRVRRDPGVAARVLGLQAADVDRHRSFIQNEQ